MIRKALCGLLILMTLLCGGCWNYRSVDEMTLVAGIAIDRDAQNNRYKVTFQVVDLSGNITTEGIQAKLVESEGKTLFDAARNAKKRIIGRLYFGHAQTVIISEDIARNNDLISMIDWLIRDSEVRETAKILISAEKTAADILKNETIVSPVSAFEISKDVEIDNQITSSTVYRQLYQIFNILHAEGVDLALPALHNVLNNGEYTVELYGCAVFKAERMIGYLTPDESKYFLIAINELKGGVLTCPFEESGADDVALEISKNTTKPSFTFKDGKLKIRVEIEMDTYLDEVAEHINALENKQIVNLENIAAQTLASRVSETIKTVQTKFGSDIFGFGSMICKNDNALWKKLRENWDTLFPTLEVQVLAKVNIVNTASIKNN